MSKYSLDPISLHHYMNMALGRDVRNKDGSLSTVRTIQVDRDGVPTLIPTVWDGRVLSDEEAATRAWLSGEDWPTADTHQELREFDKLIHKDMRPEDPYEALIKALLGSMMRLK